MPLEQILVLVDFSEGSDSAIQTASEIALAHGAAIHLLHAYGPRGIVPEANFAENGRIASAQLAAIVEQLSTKGLSATADAHPGSPLDAFDAVEDRLAPELVVVGARGTSRLRTLMVGSVAQAVIDHAFAPVLVVRKTGRPSPYGCILVASDFSADAAAAASAAKLVAAPNAALHLTHIDAIPYQAVASLGSSSVDKLRQQSSARLDAEAAPLGAIPHVGSGNPAREIVRLGRKLDCDLIAVGHRGETRHRWPEGGSVASAVVRHADASVLVARLARLSEPLGEHVEEARAETYRAVVSEEHVGLIETLRDVKRLADESRELEDELLREGLRQLERIAAQVEGDHPRLATSLSAVIRTLSRMGI